MKFLLGKNRLKLAETYINRSFLDIALDPQEMVQYGWIGGHFVPMFRLMKYTSKKITKYFGHKPALELSYERETRWKMISKDSSTTYQKIFFCCFSSRFLTFWGMVGQVAQSRATLEVTCFLSLEASWTRLGGSWRLLEASRRRLEGHVGPR